MLPPWLIANKVKNNANIFNINTADYKVEQINLHKNYNLHSSVCEDSLKAEDERSLRPGRMKISQLDNEVAHLPVAVLQL